LGGGKLEKGGKHCSFGKKTERRGLFFCGKKKEQLQLGREKIQDNSEREGPQGKKKKRRRLISITPRKGGEKRRKRTGGEEWKEKGGVLLSIREEKEISTHSPVN